MIVDNFHEVWVYSGSIKLLFDVVLEILRCDDLVVHSELNVFLAVIRWFVWSGNSEMGVMASKVSEIINEHTGLQLLDLDVAKTDNCTKVSHNELFEFLDINKFSNADLQTAGVICQELCEEALSDHRMNLLLVQEFGEKVIVKLTQSDLSEPSFPAALMKQVTHHPNDVLFTFSHRFDVIQMREFFTPKMKPPLLRDERHNTIWSIRVQLRKRVGPKGVYLNVFLHRSTEGSKEEEEKNPFDDVIYAELGNNEIVSQASKSNCKRKTQRGVNSGCSIVPLSARKGKDTVRIGVVIY